MGDSHSENTLPSSDMRERSWYRNTSISNPKQNVESIKGNYRYDSSLKDGQAFLLNHVNSKVSLVIMYADLVGSTNMSMILPVDKMVTIIRAFTYEMSSIVRNYSGYVLKYVGDAIIAFFPSGYNKLLSMW